MRTEANLPDFDPDLPITTAKGDRLGRAEFAESFARAIGAWRGEASLVMGLYGAWGSGKSSIKNMAVECLERDKQVDVLEFNPWMISGEDRLVEEFFCAVGCYFEERGAEGGQEGAAYRTVAERWSKFGAALAFGGRAMKAIKPLAEALPMFGRLVASVAQAALEQGAEVAHKQAQSAIEKKNASRAGGREGDPADLPTLKLNLTKALKTLTKPLLVVLDDIDRLTNDEIRVLFRVIKSNVDLPNLRFLLMFDRIVVEAALEPVATPASGYLNKIIQIGFDVPLLDRRRIEAMLLPQLDDLICRHGCKQYFDDNHFTNVYHAGLRHYLECPRDVARVLNAFKFGLALFTSAGTLEVNVVDQFALDTLRTLEPRLFQSLPSVSDLLTSIGVSSSKDDRAKEFKERLLVVLDEVGDSTRKKWARTLLGVLFPGTKWVFSECGYARSYDPSILEEWNRKLRVCHPSRFGTYFRLAVADDQISEAEFKQLVRVAGNYELFLSACHDFQASGKLLDVLSRLTDLAEVAPQESLAALSHALIDLADSLPAQEEGVFQRHPLQELLLALGKVAVRCSKLNPSQVLTGAVKKSRGTVAVAGLVDAGDECDSGGEAVEGLQLSGHDLVYARRVAVERIAGLAEGKKLLTHNYLGFLVYRLIAWDGEDVAQTWAQSEIVDAAAAVVLSRALRRVSYSFGGEEYAGRERSKFDIETLVKLRPREWWFRTFDYAAIVGLDSRDKKLVSDLLDQMETYGVQTE